VEVSSDRRSEINDLLLLAFTITTDALTSVTRSY
jgi:hypothetical protein